MDTIKQKLTHMREVEGVTGPLYCLASAKFLAGKLVGLYDRRKHLNDFMGSSWASDKSNGGLGKIKNAWGHADKAAVEDFNTRVLKASVELEDAGVKADHPPTTNPVEFVYFYNARVADHLLAQHVPVVAGVAWDESLKRKHFITLVADRAGAVWEVDPWDGEPGVVPLSDDFTFTQETPVASSMGSITIPSRPFFFGYYRECDSETPLKATVA
jgi:hypothetical protein